MGAYSIRKILVPVDLSDTSLNALDSAIAIAKKHKSALQILHVSESLLESAEKDLPASSLKAANEVLHALLAAIEHSNEIKPKLLQKKGTVVESVVSVAMLEQPDLIIMGTHGASGYRPGFMGSNTYRVIKYSTCPVLTIPPKRKFNHFENALFPIRPVSGALARYDVACHFLSAQSSIEVLGLSYLRMERETTILDKIADEIKEQADAGKVKLKTSWSSDSYFTDHILQLTQEGHYDLLILTSSLDAISKSKFIGPNTQKVINASKIPLLVIKHVSIYSFA